MNGDERYVKICNGIKARGTEIRERVFQALEEMLVSDGINCDADLITDSLEELRRLDTLFMLSMKTGMEIAEKRQTESESPPKKVARK